MEDLEVRALEEEAAFLTCQCYKASYGGGKVMRRNEYRWKPAEKHNLKRYDIY